MNPKAKNDSAQRVGTYPSQWYYSLSEQVFLFKKNPEWVVPLSHFNQRFFLWTDVDGEAVDPATAIISTFGSHVEGRIWDDNEIAGVVTRDGKRMLNIPQRRLDDTRDKIAA